MIFQSIFNKLVCGGNKDKDNEQDNLLLITRERIHNLEREINDIKIDIRFINITLKAIEQKLK